MSHSPSRTDPTPILPPCREIQKKDIKNPNEKQDHEISPNNKCDLFFFSFKYVILFPKRLTDYTKLLGRFPCCIFDESQKFKILIIAPVFTVPQTLHSYASLNFWDEAVIPGSVTRFSRSDVRFPNPTRKTFMAVGEPDY